MNSEVIKNRMLLPVKSINTLLALMSVIFTGSFFYYVYDLFQQYDWGQSFTKLLCFMAIFTLLLLQHRNRTQHRLDAPLYHKAECILAAVALGWVLWSLAPQYLSYMEMGPRVDIGYTTQNSAIMLFQEGQNPYLSEHINVRPELKPEHRGFHYGPGMILGYAASAFWPNLGYKITNLACLVVTLLSLIVLIDSAREKGADAWQRISSVILVSALLLLPERLWYELFLQGASDIYPVMLLLLGLMLVQKKLWLWAGIAMGLSFAAKFSPAAFLLVLFLRKDIKLHFFLGCCIGASPMVAFGLWDFNAMIENVFVLRFTLNYDSTSLYSITPVALHYLFPLTQACSVLYLLIHNFNKTLDTDTLILHFALLLIIIEITFKEIHANHLVWFYPLFAYLAVKHRHKLLPGLATEHKA